MKIRCDDCRKKISVDDAFAGGVCRCPYCKAIVTVAGDSTKVSHVVRPDAPIARPGAPDVAAPPAAIAEEEIPMARPVMIQGVVTIVLLGLLAVMLVVGVFLVVHLVGDSNGDQAPPPPPPAINAFGWSVPSTVAGDIKIETPVVYVVDGGSSMGRMLDFALRMTRASVRSLKGDQKFNVVISMEEGDRVLSPEGVGGGLAGDKKASEFIEQAVDAGAGYGASDLARAMDAAIEKKPRTVVLFISKKQVPDGAALAEKLKAAGVKVVALSLNSDPSSIQSAAKLAETTGGVGRSYLADELHGALWQAPPLD